MLSVRNLSLAFGKRTLFKDVNLDFNHGNCYGVIGANGCGKSTFLKILCNEISASSGDVIVGKNERMAVLKQDHFEYDEFDVINAVIMGHKTLYDIMIERNEIYAKGDFTDEEGMRVANLEVEFGEMGGYEADSEAATLLRGLGLATELHCKKVGDLESSEKVRVLLAQALFGNPEILLLDEPTNHLDLTAIAWLEDYIEKFENTVIVVSHDRHFLNSVCTHTTDIDYSKIKTFVGNYDFWFHASQLSMKQSRDVNKKMEDKRDELKSFISRFSSNASKAKQATSRKKLLEKMTLEDIPTTSRKFPYVNFSAERECGKIILNIEDLTIIKDGVTLLKNFNLSIAKGDKIAFVGENDLIKTALFETLTSDEKPESGIIKWGKISNYGYFPMHHDSYFDCDLPLIDWLRQYSNDDDESFIRGFLGRMLFSGDEALKKSSVLSGGEKVRCMLSKLMLSNANVLLLDEPTNHLDLESISALNDGLSAFKEVVLFAVHDHQFIQTVANRIIELSPNGVIDKYMDYDEFLRSDEVKARRKELGM